MKQFFEEYGGVALGILAVLVLIAMVSPVGAKIKESLTGVVNGFSESLTEGFKGATGTDESKEEEAVYEGTVSVGSTLTLGTYEQNGDYSSSEDITWKVLAVQEGKAFVTTEKALEIKAIGTSTTTWENNEIRSFLNGEFLESFTDEEKAIIIESTIDTDNISTTDKVFLLSKEEVNTYLGSNNTCYKTGKVETQINQQDYAVEGYWLRNTGYAVKEAYKSETWTIGTSTYTYNTVRPAMWIRIK